MNLILFHPLSIYCAWAVSTGLGDVFQRMGHNVSVFPINATVDTIDKKMYPSAKQLREADGIVVSGPEHLNRHILALYPEWTSISTPKVAWMHETVERLDDDQASVNAIHRFVQKTFTSAIQDTKYGMRWMPFGVDTEVFKPNGGQPKLFDVAFIGYLYPKRAAFLETVRPHLGDIKILCGNVQVRDLAGVKVRETAALYADNLRSIKVFVNFPSMSELAVTKVTEAQACGTFLITPILRHQQNYEGIQAHFYDPERPESLAESIRFCLERDQEREEAARICCEQVHRLHKLENRCEILLQALNN